MALHALQSASFVMIVMPSSKIAHGHEGHTLAIHGNTSTSEVVML